MDSLYDFPYQQEETEEKKEEAHPEPSVAPGQTSDRPGTFAIGGATVKSRPDKPKLPSYKRRKVAPEIAEELVTSVLNLPRRDPPIIKGFVNMVTEEQMGDALAEDAVANLPPEADRNSEDAARLREAARKDAPKTHGLATLSGQIYVKQGKGDQATLIHESVHKYGAHAFLTECCAGMSQGINEGVTEYFTRQVTGTLGWGRDAYNEECRIITQLVKKLGADGDAILKRAYFDQDRAGRIALFQAFRKATGQDWTPVLKDLQVAVY